MKYSYDLHIHSALSPCADEEMTPNNIVNMALLKELDIIAVTDHNSAENLAAVGKCAREAGIVFVPGMEIETSEEVHLLCYFPDVECALKVQEKVYASLPQMENREDIFGSQLIMDENDRVIGKLGRMLMTATSLSVEEVFNLVEKVGGVVVPAHIDRDSYSIISNLGFIPEGLNINCVEISKDCNADELLKRQPELAGYRRIQSSDAHYLGDIAEREVFIELEELSVKVIWKNLLMNEG